MTESANWHLLFALFVLCVLPLCHSFLQTPFRARGDVLRITSGTGSALACVSLSSIASFIRPPPTRRNRATVTALKMFVKDEVPGRTPSKSERGPTTILIVRHGETEWNTQGRWQGQQDSPLTPEGEQQAKALGARLKEAGRKLDAVYTSDLMRAFRSAQFICDACGIDKSKLRVEKLLRERCFGVFEGKTREEVMKEWPEKVKAYQGPDGDFKVEGAESRNEMLARSMKWLELIGNEHEGETVLVMTHGAVVSSLIRHLLSIPYDPKPPADIKIRNTCMCEIRREQGQHRWTVLTIGDVAHTEKAGIHEITNTVEQDVMATNTVERKETEKDLSLSRIKKFSAPVIAGLVGFLIGVVGKGQFLRLLM